MRDIGLFLFVFSSLPITVFRPYYGLLLWSWLGYMNPHRLTWGPAFEFPFVQVVALATLAGIVFDRTRKAPRVSFLLVIWFLFLCWMSLTTLTAFNSEAAILEWQRTMKIQIMVAATLLLVNTKERIKWLVIVIAASIGFFGIKGGIFTILTGGQFLVWGPPGTFIEGNNEVAFAILITIPLFRYMQLRTENRKLRLLLGVAMVLMGLSVVGSYSRGAFLGAGAMVFVMALKSPRRKLFVPSLVIAGLLIFSFMPDKWTDRMETIQDYTQDESALGRINAWWFAFRLAKDNPITGGGFQTFSPDLFYRYAPIPEDFHDAHSIYFEVLAEHGFVGLTLFLAMGLGVLLTAGSTIRASKRDPTLEWAGQLAGMLQVSFVGYAVGGAFLGLAYFDLPYHLLALVVLTHGLVREKTRAEQQLPVRGALAQS